MAAFDVITEDRDALIRLLKDWTAAAEDMTQGRETGETGAAGGSYDAPPQDTGEAMGLSAGKLTVTFGFGASLFEKDGKARFGLEGRRPDALIDLPHFPGDDLQAGRSGGDIILQACADDPQVAVHAIRNLARLGFGKVRVRWSQLGFGRTSSTSRASRRPATFSASRTAPTTSKSRTPACWTAMSGRGPAPGRAKPGCRAEATWWRAASGCTSRSGTGRHWANRKA